MSRRRCTNLLLSDTETARAGVQGSSCRPSRCVWVRARLRACMRYGPLRSTHHQTRSVPQLHPDALSQLHKCAGDSPAPALF